MYRYLLIHLHLCLSDAYTGESTVWKLSKTKLFRNKLKSSFSLISSVARTVRPRVPAARIRTPSKFVIFKKTSDPVGFSWSFEM